MNAPRTLTSEVRTALIRTEMRPWQTQNALLRVVDYAETCLGGPAGAVLVETVAQALGLVAPEPVDEPDPDGDLDSREAAANEAADAREDYDAPRVITPHYDRPGAADAGCACTPDERCEWHQQQPDVRQLLGWAQGGGR